MLRLMLMLAALVAAPPPDPASVHVAQPQPYELWDGRVRGTAPAGSTLVVVSGKHRWRVPVAADGGFDKVLPGVPRGDGNGDRRRPQGGPRVRGAERVDLAACRSPVLI